MSADSRVASRYAKSLLSLAEEQGKLEEVHNDMQLVDATCKESRDLAVVLKNPIIKHDKKRSILEAIFKNKVSDLTLAIFEIICRKNREEILPAIAEEFHIQYNVFKGIEKATVTTAVKIDKGLRESFEKMIKQISDKKTVELEEIVDEKIIGGYVLKVGDRQLDDSIKSKITELELQFSKNPYIKEF
jgi:F-type H+-transporting ATPase subunit delta